MLYTITRSIDTYTITNTSGTPIIVQVEYSADCNDNENFSVLNPTVTLNTNDTTSFTMTSDGIYKVDIEDTVLNSSGTYQLDTKYFTKYDTLLNSFISDVEYSLCGCGCTNCPDCNDNQNDLLSTITKILAYNAISKSIYYECLGAAQDCISCDVLNLSNCNLITESVTGNIDNTVLFRRLVAYYYYVFYYTDVQVTGDKQGTDAKYHISKIAPCIKKLGFDFDCVKTSIVSFIENQGVVSGIGNCSDCLVDSLDANSTTLGVTQNAVANAVNTINSKLYTAIQNVHIQNSTYNPDSNNVTLIYTVTDINGSTSQYSSIISNLPSTVGVQSIVNNGDNTFTVTTLNSDNTTSTSTISFEYNAGSISFNPASMTPAWDSSITDVQQVINYLNTLINTINSSLTALQTQVNTNTTNISTNTTAIATLNTTVSTNTTNIENLQTQVNTNTTNITTNTTNITANTSEINNIKSVIGSFEQVTGHFVGQTYDTYADLIASNPPTFSVGDWTYVLHDENVDPTNKPTTVYVVGYTDTTNTTKRWEFLLIVNDTFVSIMDEFAAPDSPTGIAGGAPIGSGLFTFEYYASSLRFTERQYYYDSVNKVWNGLAPEGNSNFIFGATSTTAGLFLPDEKTKLASLIPISNTGNVIQNSDGSMSYNFNPFIKAERSVDYSTRQATWRFTKADNTVTEILFNLELSNYDKVVLDESFYIKMRVNGTIQGIYIDDSDRISKFNSTSFYLEASNTISYARNSIYEINIGDQIYSYGDAVPNNFHQVNAINYNLTRLSSSKTINLPINTTCNILNLNYTGQESLIYVSVTDTNAPIVGEIPQGLTCNELNIVAGYVTLQNTKYKKLRIYRAITVNGIFTNDTHIEIMTSGSFQYNGGSHVLVGTGTTNNVFIRLNGCIEKLVLRNLNDVEIYFGNNATIKDIDIINCTNVKFLNVGTTSVYITNLTTDSQSISFGNEENVIGALNIVNLMTRNTLILASDGTRSFLRVENYYATGATVMSNSFRIIASSLFITEPKPTQSLSSSLRVTKNIHIFGNIVNNIIGDCDFTVNNRTFERLYVYNLNLFYHNLGSSLTSNSSVNVMVGLGVQVFNGSITGSNLIWNETF